MRKIAFYINAINGGGAARVMTNLANQYAGQGEQVLFITSFPTKEEYQLHESISRINLDVNKISGSFIKRNLFRIYRLRSICKRENPDILISFMAEPNFRAVIATLGLSTKTLISVRNVPSFEYAGRKGKITARYILPLSDGCVFQTADAKKYFPQRLQKKSRVIPNAVSNKFYTTEHIPKKGLIVTCGRLEPQKNHSMLIDVFEEFVKMYPEAQLKIYGIGTLQIQLKSKVKERKLGERIHFMGQVEDVPSVLSEADIFVLPSDFEGMPNALMEAMAMGIPCVSTDCPCGGPKELIVDGINGVLVPVKDKEKMLKVLKKIYENEIYKKSLGEKAHKTAEKYKLSTIAKAWDDYIMQILSGCKRDS